MRVAKSRNFVINIVRKVRINLLKIYYARGSAHEIALGAAIGSALISFITALFVFFITKFFITRRGKGALVSK